MESVNSPARLNDKDNSTKILVIEEDLKNFEVRRCIAQALGLLNTVTLLHVPDVSEALRFMEKESPDVIIFSEDNMSEKKFLLESLGEKHLPIVFQTSNTEHFKQKQSISHNIMYVPEYDTLEGMHQVLLLAANMGKRFTDAKLASEAIH